MSLPSFVVEDVPSRVLFVVGQGVEQVHRLPEHGTVSIGRGLDNQIRLTDPLVSRRHALLHVGSEVWIEDLASSNGILVGPAGPSGDGHSTLSRIQCLKASRARVTARDVVYIGSATLAIRDASQAHPAIRPASPRAGGEALRSEQEVITSDPKMRRILHDARRYAASTISVLLLGETGVGKEVLAAAIHQASPRHGRPLLRINCGALPEALLESHLFGHERGAFTGATCSKPGLLETADGGTVFLDEIGELPLSAQVKLLRVLEDGELLRVGGLRPRSIDVRFIAATNRDLRHEIARGTFREDLYFRIGAATLSIPPLRERPEEIEAFVRVFMRRACERIARREPELSRGALELLRAHHWPGNVRELRNVVESALLLCPDGVLTPEHLALTGSRCEQTAGRAITERAPPPDETVGREPETPSFSDAVRAPKGLLPRELRQEILRAERRRVEEALESCGGNQTQAARLLGISRRTLISRLEAFGMPRPRKRSAD